LNPIQINLQNIKHVGVKVSQFSFGRLPGADPILGVEMASTGEVACFGTNIYQAYMKGLIATAFKIPNVQSRKNILVSIGSYKEKAAFLPYADSLSKMGFTLFGTPGTADFFATQGIPIQELLWPLYGKILHHPPQCKCECAPCEENHESVLHYLSSGQIHLSIILQSNKAYKRPTGYLSKGYFARRKSIDMGISLFTNLQEAQMFVEAIKSATVAPHMGIGAPDQLTTHTDGSVQESNIDGEYPNNPGKNLSQTTKHTLEFTETLSRQNGHINFKTPKTHTTIHS